MLLKYYFGQMLGSTFHLSMACCFSNGVYHLQYSTNADLNEFTCTAFHSCIVMPILCLSFIKQVSRVVCHRPSKQSVVIQNLCSKVHRQHGVHKVHTGLSPFLLYLSLSVSLHCPSVCLSSLSISLPVFPFVHLSLFLSVHLSLCLSRALALFFLIIGKVLSLSVS